MSVSNSGSLATWRRSIPAGGRRHVSIEVLEPRRLFDCSLPADFNGDGNVGFDDLLILAENFRYMGAHQVNGDADGDGFVDFDDLLILAQTYGQKCPMAAKAPFAAVAHPAPAHARS